MKRHCKSNFSMQGIGQTKRAGLTLIELMVVILIFLIISAAIFGVLSVGRQSWRTGSTQVELQQETRKAMDWMIKEIRQSGLDYGPKYAGQVIGLAADDNFHNTITFRKSEGWDNTNAWIDWGNQVTYLLGGLNGEQLLRTSGGSTIILANKVVSLQFKRPSATPKVVEISLQAQKDAMPGGRTMQSTLNSQVTLRN